MKVFDRIASLKGEVRVEVYTRGGHFRGEIESLSMTEVEMRTYTNLREGVVVQEIAYIPIEEICMIVHRPTQPW